MAYLLNMYALREVPPTTIGVLTYVQPIIAIVYASFTGNDKMDGVKTLATLLVFVGVYLVNQKEKASLAKSFSKPALNFFHLSLSCAAGVALTFK